MSSTSTTNDSNQKNAPHYQHQLPQPQPPQPPHQPQRRTTSARRVLQLAVQHSIENLLQSPAAAATAAAAAASSFTSGGKYNNNDPSSDNHSQDDNPWATTHSAKWNIDQALRSLYEENGSVAYLTTTSSNNSGSNSTSFQKRRNSAVGAIESSYTLNDDNDWLLDGTEEWEQEAQDSAILLQKLVDSSNLNLLLQHVAIEVVEEEEEEDDDDEDFEFGDFQSATIAPTTTTTTTEEGEAYNEEKKQESELEEGKTLEEVKTIECSLETGHQEVDVEVNENESSASELDDGDGDSKLVKAELVVVEKQESPQQQSQDAQAVVFSLDTGLVYEETIEKDVSSGSEQGDGDYMSVEAEQAIVEMEENHQQESHDVQTEVFETEQVVEEVEELNKNVSTGSEHCSVEDGQDEMLSQEVPSELLDPKLELSTEVQTERQNTPSSGSGHCDKAERLETEETTLVDMTQKVGATTPEAQPNDQEEADSGSKAWSQLCTLAWSPGSEEVEFNCNSGETTISSPALTMDTGDSNLDHSVLGDSPSGMEIPLQVSVDEEEARVVANTTKTLSRLLLDQNTPRISLVLPLDDLSSPQARFARRLQLSHQEHIDDENDASISPLPPTAVEQGASVDDYGLPSYYFTRDFDDTVRVLESLPWRCLRDYQPTGCAAYKHSSSSDAFDSSEWDLWEESMVSRLCELDTALNCVSGHLLSGVQPYQDKLRKANEVIYDWEQNLRLAFKYWERSQQALAESVGVEEGSGLLGPNVLLETWNQKDDCNELNSALEELKVLFEKENDLFKRIDSFDTRESDALNEYFAVAELSFELEKSVRQGRLSGLKCLDDLRERLTTTSVRFWKRLLTLSESVVVRSCRKHSFDWMEYERLVRAVLDLRSNAFDTENHVNVAEDWSQSILQALCHEADRALATALLEPTDSEPSEYEKELAHYMYEFNYGWGDGAKLKTVIHNLVTIRFCFESQTNYLPSVFHKLMVGLADVLHTHYLFTQWHLIPFDERSRSFEALHDISETDSSCEDSELASILAKLQDSRVVLWRHCEDVIERCLGEYLDFATRPTLFQAREDGVDDSAWLEELEGLQQILFLADRFYALKSPFFCELQPSPRLPSLRDAEGTASSLYEKLGLVFRGHLRSVHVAAMEAMGRTLSKESWILASSVSEDQSVETSADIETILLGALCAVSKIPKRESLEESADSKDQSTNPFAVFPAGNPFGATIATFDQQHVSCSATRVCETPSQSYSDAREYIYKVLGAPATEKHDERLRMFAPACVSNALIDWFSRLVDIITKLPLIVEDVSAVIANVCDLYFTTVFRICSGCSKNERILLGEEAPSPFVVLRNSGVKSPRPSAKDARSPIFSSFRMSVSNPKNKNPARAPSVLPVALEAEMFAPLLKDVGNISSLREFLMRAQKSLRDVVNLDKVDSWLVDPVHTTETLEEHVCGVTRLLEKRQGAIWSCFVVAALADVALSVARSRIAETFLGSYYVEDLVPLTSYVRTMLEITPGFAALACQFSCVRAIGGFEVVKGILRVGGGWEECKLHAHPNDYVDELEERCALIWGFLCVSAKLPFVVRKTVWGQVVSGAYLSLLEGFARVPFCSTEGRALMTLDLASFSAGIASASISDRLERRALIATPPPPVKPERSEGYVDTYIKVFYYPTEDVLSWMEDNYKNYQLGHSIALVSATSGNSEKDLGDMVDRVMQLYGQKGGDNT